MAASLLATAATTTAVALCAAALSLTVLPVPVATAQAAPARLERSTLRIVTYNSAHTLGPARALQDIADMMEHNPDIIALQEMASAEKRKRIRKRYIECEGCRWSGFFPRPAVPGGTPIMFRSDRFRFLFADTLMVSKRTHVGSSGAGPAWIRAKYVNWVRLRDRRSRRMVHILNNHAVPSVQGKSGGPNHRYPKRLKLYRQHMKGLQGLVRALLDLHNGHIFVTGDLNVNYRRDRIVRPAMFPYRRLGEVGMSASFGALGQPAIGTHTLGSGNGNRLIDYVYFRRSATLAPAKQQILRGFNSDHRPVLVTFKVRKARPR